MEKRLYDSTWFFKDIDEVNNLLSDDVKVYLRCNEIETEIPNSMQYIQSMMEHIDQLNVYDYHLSDNKIEVIVHTPEHETLLVTMNIEVCNDKIAKLVVYDSIVDFTEFESDSEYSDSSYDSDCCDSLYTDHDAKN